MNSKIENLQDTITDKDDYIEELEKRIEELQDEINNQDE